jgi:hypothetical protein
VCLFVQFVSCLFVCVCSSLHIHFFVFFCLFCFDVFTIVSYLILAKLHPDQGQNSTHTKLKIQYTHKTKERESKQVTKTINRLSRT